MKSRSHRAFSLIELLVVLAIVGILAALLLPVFSRVRQNGEKTTCASNLKQLASAMQIYLQDNGGAFPPESTTLVRGGVVTSFTWPDFLGSSSPVQTLLRCPSVPDSVHLGDGRADYTLGRDVSSSGYDSPDQQEAPKIRFESQFANSASTELFFESGGVMDNGVSLTGRPIKTKKCGEQPIFNLHLDGANIAYLDGHVKWMSADNQAQRDEVCGW